MIWVTIASLAVVFLGTFFLSMVGTRNEFAPAWKRLLSAMIVSLTMTVIVFTVYLLFTVDWPN